MALKTLEYKKEIFVSLQKQLSQLTNNLKKPRASEQV